jgi:SAM-dependent methyltransferase
VRLTGAIANYQLGRVMSASGCRRPGGIGTPRAAVNLRPLGSAGGRVRWCQPRCQPKESRLAWVGWSPIELVALRTQFALRGREPTASTARAYDPDVDNLPAPQEAKDIVRRGYDRISTAYRDDVGDTKAGYPLWLQTKLFPRLSPPARVLDLGCGNGVPATRMLAERFDVTGVDISDVQIARARLLVPRATFVRADMASHEFPQGSFHAVVSFFALIHVPMEEQRGLLGRVSAWLVPGGLFLATVGHDSCNRVGDFYGAPMYWSHADAPTYCRWLSDAGIDVVEREFIPEGPHGGHELVLGVRRPTGSF